MKTGNFGCCSNVILPTILLFFPAATRPRSAGANRFLLLKLATRRPRRMSFPGGGPTPKSNPNTIPILQPRSKRTQSETFRWNGTRTCRTLATTWMASGSSNPQRPTLSMPFWIKWTIPIRGKLSMIRTRERRLFYRPKNWTFCGGSRDRNLPTAMSILMSRRLNGTRAK